MRCRRASRFVIAMIVHERPLSMPISCSAALRLATIVTIGLAALASGATAQQLNLNAGTALVINDGTTSGTFVNSSNYSYAGGASAATYQYQTINTFSYDASTLLTLGIGSSAGTLNTIGTMTTAISGGTIGTLSNQGATVNVNAGSIDHLSSSGTVNVYGGLVTTLGSGSLVNVAGGTVTTLNNGGDMGVINVTGGTVGAVTNTPFGTVTITGGSVGSVEGTSGYGTTEQTTVTGGSVASLHSVANSQTFIRGGSIGTLTNDKAGYAGDPFVVAGDLQTSGGSISTLDNSGTAQTASAITTLTNEAAGSESVLGGSVGTLKNFGAATVSSGQVNFLQNFGTLTANAASGSASGGVFGAIDNLGSLTITAGQFTALHNIYGTINIYGTGLTLANGVLTGTLLDGEPLSAAYQEVNGTLNLLNSPALLALTVRPSVPGGTVVTATVTLSAVTPTDAVVGLSSSDSSVVRLHRAVIVPAGASSATFDINTYRSHVTQTVTIQAALGAAALTQNLTIVGR